MVSYTTRPWLGLKQLPQISLAATSSRYFVELVFAAWTCLLWILLPPVHNFGLQRNLARFWAANFIVLVQSFPKNSVNCHKNWIIFANKRTDQTTKYSFLDNIVINIFHIFTFCGRIFFVAIDVFVGPRKSDWKYRCSPGSLRWKHLFLVSIHFVLCNIRTQNAIHQICVTQIEIALTLSVTSS